MIDLSKFKIPLSTVIVLFGASIGYVIQGTTLIKQIEDNAESNRALTEQLASITSRTEVSTQAILQANVTQLMSDRDKLLVLSDDNMNKHIRLEGLPAQVLALSARVNAIPAPKPVDLSSIHATTNRLEQQLNTVSNSVIRLESAPKLDVVKLLQPHSEKLQFFEREINDLWDANDEREDD